MLLYDVEDALDVRKISVHIHHDSESRAVEGAYGYNPGYHRGIYIGGVNDGVVRAFIPDPNPSGGTSFPEGISVADDSTIWGASVGNQTAWKWVREP